MTWLCWRAVLRNAAPPKNCTFEDNNGKPRHIPVISAEAYRIPPCGELIVYSRKLQCIRGYRELERLVTNKFQQGSRAPAAHVLRALHTAILGPAAHGAGINPFERNCLCVCYVWAHSWWPPYNPLIRKSMSCKRLPVCFQPPSFSGFVIDFFVFHI